jgi:hypothetical protein
MVPLSMKIKGGHRKPYLIDFHWEFGILRQVLNINISGRKLHNISSKKFYKISS